MVNSVQTRQLNGLGEVTYFLGSELKKMGSFVQAHNIYSPWGYYGWGPYYPYAYSGCYFAPSVFYDYDYGYCAPATVVYSGCGCGHSHSSAPEYRPETTCRHDYSAPYGTSDCGYGYDGTGFQTQMHDESISETFAFLDRISHPLNYNSDGTPKTEAQKKEIPLQIVNPTTGEDETPAWYSKIAQKVEENQPLTADEKRLKEPFENLRKKYSLTQRDKDGNVKCDSTGKPLRTPFYEKVYGLHLKIQGKCRDAIERYINSCSREELAAMEILYPQVGGKSLREAIKDATIVTGFTWGRWNTDRCSRIFDKLDEAAMVTPGNMAAALKQALTDHGLTGLRSDNTRLEKLLSKLVEDKAFKEAVLMEYPGLTAELGGTVKSAFLSDKVEELALKLEE